ncbi:hypothetical protein C0Q70_03905 [Pomacea canaliculata]|uniref:G-protein coupled receptors family 1 profile domain-containing protein n=2 Tax=Pomacea canaliculata TaxID=400727 RepID=A0A2T7PU12_POMCA|nr:hypothetical protein C0Q70_03905 [Pomacea canaliculata]
MSFPYNKSESPPPPSIVLKLDTASRVINSTVPVVIIIAGCVTNVFIIMGMRSKNFRSMTTAYYMKCLALNDIAAIVILLVPYWLNAACPEAIYRGPGANIQCKFFMFYGWIQMDLSFMLMAMMSYDRAITVGVELLKKFDRLCTVRFVTRAYEVFWNSVWPWMHLVFQAGCFLWMAVCNGHVMKFITETHRQAGWLHEELPIQMSRMLLAESLTFTFLTLPVCVHTFVSGHMQRSGVIDIKSGTTPVAVGVSSLLFTIAFNLLFVNKCVTFAVYCCFSKELRTTMVQQLSACQAPAKRLTSCPPPPNPLPDDRTVPCIGQTLPDESQFQRAEVEEEPTSMDNSA